MQELLRHEQLHFDIFELYARKIRKYLSEYSNPQGMEQQMKKAVNLLIAEQEKVNLQYDTESVHSTNKPMQKKWESKVTEELKKNDAFANTHVVREL
jgi:predicted secreted Zn-dependent protease